MPLKVCESWHKSGRDIKQRMSEGSRVSAGLVLFVSTILIARSVISSSKKVRQLQPSQSGLYIIICVVVISYICVILFAILNYESITF